MGLTRPAERVKNDVCRITPFGSHGNLESYSAGNAGDLVLEVVVEDCML